MSASTLLAMALGSEQAPASERTSAASSSGAEQFANAWLCSTCSRGSKALRGGFDVKGVLRRLCPFDCA